MSKSIAEKLPYSRYLTCVYAYMLFLWLFCAYAHTFEVCVSIDRGWYSYLAVVRGEMDCFASEFLGSVSQKQFSFFLSARNGIPNTTEQFVIFG
jgi:hypothetical protein